MLPADENAVAGAALPAAFERALALHLAPTLLLAAPRTASPARGFDLERALPTECLGCVRARVVATDPCLGRHIDP